VVRIASPWELFSGRASFVIALRDSVWGLSFHFVLRDVGFLMTIQMYIYLWNAEQDQMADQVDFLAAHDAGFNKVKPSKSFWNVDVVA